jgi:hypothetical protein
MLRSFGEDHVGSTFQICGKVFNLALYSSVDVEVRK